MLAVPVHENHDLAGCVTDTGLHRSTISHIVRMLNDSRTRQASFFLGGPTEFVEILEAWRADGNMKGLKLG